MKKNYLFLVGIGALLAMSSCSQDEDIVVKNGKNAALKLTLSGTTVGTRVLGTLTDEADNKISNVTVGVFRTPEVPSSALDGYADAIENISVIESSANPRTFVFPENTKIAVTAGQRDILVVANTTSDEVALLKSKITKHDFLITALGLLDKHQNKDMLLMTGQLDNQPITKGIINPVNMEVTRLVGRVQLVSLKSLFTNSYSNAVLDVDKIFLHNALFEIPVDGSVPGTKKFYTGWETPILGIYTPDLVDEIVSPYSLKGKPETNYLINGNHYFYTFPNEASTFATATKLVISGIFYPNGKAAGEPFYYVYYPIVVNKDVVPDIEHTGVGIERNYVYSINATILRPGVLDPDKPLDPASISLTITVNPWFPTISQTNDL